MRPERRKKLYKTVTILAVVAVLGCAVWIHIVLFLAWGWLMYRLWVWIDKR